jgi:hypothetical protein
MGVDVGIVKEFESTIPSSGMVVNDENGEERTEVIEECDAEVAVISWMRLSEWVSGGGEGGRWR